METVPTLVVYRYLAFDARSRTYGHAERSATLERIGIERGLGLGDTALEVDASRVDGQGFLLEKFESSGPRRN
jgi:hypothetical protein